MTTSPPEQRGLLVIDKPEGLTSHDVVARLRRALGIRRVGHAGTLDPMATGVLVLGCGAGTRLLPFVQPTAKQYAATIRLGWSTTTDDRLGEPIGAPAAVPADPVALDDALAGLRGTIEQRPSSVSAIKVGGERAYARVRRGEDVAIPARTVTVDRLERTSPLRRNEHGGADVDIVVDCSSGTYVRALARDAGERLGCGGHLIALRRTRVGPFDLAQAVPVPAPGQVPSLIPLGSAAAELLPTVRLGPDEVGPVGSGVRLPAPPGAQAGPTALLSPAGELVAVAAPADGRWKYLAVFA